MTCLGTCQAAPAAGPGPCHRAGSALSRRRCAGPRGESAVLLSALSSFISLTIKQKAVEEEVPFDNTNEWQIKTKHQVEIG